MRGLLVLPLLSALLAAQAAPELVVSVGHSGAPRFGAFAGRYLVTSAGSNIAFIDLSTGITVSRTSQGLLVMAIEPSPAGDLVAIGTCTHAIHLYEVNTLTLVRRIPTRNECASSLSFTPDGALLVADNYACCRGGGGLQVWNVRTGDIARELPGVSNIRQVAFGGNRWLAVVDHNGKGSVLEWPTGHVLRTFAGPEHPGANGTQLMASRDARYLAWTELGAPAHVLDVTSGNEVKLPVERHTLTSTAAFLDEGRFAYIEEDQLFVMPLPNGPVQTMPLASTALQTWDTITRDPEAWLTIRRDGLMAAGKRENETLVWDVAGARLRDVKAPALVESASLQWTRTGLIAFANRYAGLRAWDDRQGRPADLGTAITFVESVAFRPDGARAAVGGSRIGTDSMFVLDVARRRPIAARTLPPAADAGVAYSPDGSRLAFQSPSGFWLFDGTLRPLRKIATLEQYGSVERVAFSGDGRWIAASLGGPNPSLQVWPAAQHGDAVTLDRERVTYGNRSLAFSHDSKWLASVRKGSSLTVWSTVWWTAARSWTLPDTIRGVAFAPRDSRLALTSDSDAGIWDATDGRRLATLSSPGSTTRGDIAWSPDGRRVVTSADDGVLRFWRASDGELIASLYLFDASADWLLVTPDERFDGSDAAITGFIAWRVSDRVSQDAGLTRARRVRGLWQALPK